MPSVVTMPTGEHKPFIRQDTVSSRQVPDQMSSRSAKNKEQMPEREKAEGSLVLLFRFSLFLTVILFIQFSSLHICKEIACMVNDHELLIYFL